MSRATALEMPIEDHLHDAGGMDRDPEIASYDYAPLAQRALVMLRADGVAIGLRTPEGVICCATAGDLAPDKGVLVDQESGLTGECMRTRRMVACADTSSDARVNSSTAAAGIGSVMIVPVIRGDVVAGVVEALWSHAHACTAQDQRVLESCAAEVLALVTESCPNVAALQPLSPLPAAADVDIPGFLKIPAAPARKSRPRWWGILAAVLASAIVLFVVGISSHHQAQSLPVPAAESSAINPQLVASLQRSAEAGNVGAQSSLATFYWTGRGVPQDNITAYMWSIIAATHGDHNSVERLEMLRTTMSRDSVNVAEHRANTWLAQHRKSEPE